MSGVVTLIKEDHKQLEAVFRKLEAPGVDGLIAAMIGEVRHHVEEEEKEILPAFADAASNQQLSELGEQFAEAKERAAAEMAG